MNSPNKRIVWPASTRHGEERTYQEIFEILNLIEEHKQGNIDELQPDDVKGIKGRSLLLDIPSFDYLNGVVAEYMYLGCLGVVRRLVELTFSVGEKRPRKIDRKLTNPSLLNQLISSVKWPNDFSRRIRDLDFSVYKAEEFRNLILFLFPLVIQCLPNEPKERKIWLLLAFVLRATTLPEDEYAEVNKNKIKQSLQNLYILYEHVYGVENCTYSIHVLFSHLMKIRVLGPLTETSAFKFESFYGELRESFATGTVSPLKQILQNVYLKRALAFHSCQKPIEFSNKDTNLTCNSLIYTTENESTNVFKIQDIVDNQFVCHSVGKLHCSFTETPGINWDSVGVFKRGGLISENTVIIESQIKGKVVAVGDYLITCPKNVLQEK